MVFFVVDGIRLVLPTGIPNLLCMVLPPALAAAQPDGHTTATQSSVWNNVFVIVTRVWIRVVFPVPAFPRIVKRSGSKLWIRFLLFPHSNHSLVFEITSNAISLCSFFKSSNTYLLSGRWEFTGKRISREFSSSASLILFSSHLDAPSDLYL